MLEEVYGKWDARAYEFRTMTSRILDHGYWKVRAQESAWLSDDIGIGESKGPGEESSPGPAKNEESLRT